MSLVVLQPTGSKVSRVHYNDTVKNTVDLNDIKSLVTDKVFEELTLIYPNGKAHIWGVTKGKDEVNANKWRRIQKGDVTFFSADRKLYTSGTVAYTIQNVELAKSLWGVNENNETWEYIYFLDNIKNHDIAIQDINRLIGYKENYVVQGFTVLSEEKSELIISEYDFESEKFHTDIDKELIKDKLKALLGTGTDKSRYVNTRKEQKLLREYLFDEKYMCTCGLCGEDFPVEFLHTAHKKKRKFCTEEERLDVENIVMPVCKFGCDDLYEKGYIVIDDEGKVKVNKFSGISTFNSKIEKLKDNECQYWNSDSQKYFEWHRTFHNYKNV